MVRSSKRNEGLALAEGVNELAHPVDIGELGVLEQTAPSPSMTSPRVARFADRLVTELEGAVPERVDLHAVVWSRRAKSSRTSPRTAPFDHVGREVVDARELALVESGLRRG